MDVLHITQTKNIPSIMRNGIFRCKPLLSQYSEIMKKDYEDEYDAEKGLVFGIPESLNRRDKYIKDFFYWKTWGDKRNIFLDDCDYEQFTKYQEMGPAAFKHIKMESMQFSVLLIDIPHDPLYDMYIHNQSNCMGELWSDMDTRYEHYSKPLTLINYDVEAKRIKKVIGNGESIVTKSGKINVLLKT